MIVTIAVLLALPLRTIAGSSDPVAGTWELDLSKSSFSPGPPPKSQTRVYKLTRSGLNFTLTGIGADGRPVNVHYTARYDGKDYPFVGSPRVDTVALKRINRLRVDGIEKKDGRVIFNVTRVISDDGKVMTVTMKGTTADGSPVSNVLVFGRR